MTSCAALARDEPQAGTAPHSRGWLVLEHPGPYGRVAADALGEVGELLRDECRAAGITLLLARRPRLPRDAPRRAWLALGGRMIGWSDLNPASMSGQRWASLDDPALPQGAVEMTGPEIFVCTNGKRDACCALLGRPVADALIGDSVHAWECSHIGGHRFAATAVVLPFGSVHGRLTIDTAREVLAAAQRHRCHVGSLRGMSHLPAEQQVADAAVRQRSGLTEAVRLDVSSTGDDGRVRCEVVHPDGRRWSVSLRRESGPARPESCDREPLTPESWVLDSIDA